jgi:thiosulfate/3-mercaptopyruvate sulfurtransferase
MSAGYSSFPGCERRQMTYRTLIRTDELAGHLNDPSWVILDARFDLEDEQWAKSEFAGGHIRGAFQADLADHMAGPVIPGKTGRRPFPEPEIFAQQLSAWGIDETIQVVTYDAANGLMAASRLWLMLKWLGHDNVAVLNGGLPAWLAEGRLLTSEVSEPRQGKFVARVRHELLASVDEVNNVRLDDRYCVFDARSNDGIPSHDAIKGHIPGARFADRAQNTGTDGHFRSSEELRTHYESLIGETPPERVIFYCGSGVTAAQNILGITHAGLEGPRLYVGSWSEWILDPKRPVES